MTRRGTEGSSTTMKRETCAMKSTHGNERNDLQS